MTISSMQIIGLPLKHDKLVLFRPNWPPETWFISQSDFIMLLLALDAKKSAKNI